MDLSYYGDRYTFFRCHVRREVWQKIEANFGTPAEACKALRIELEAAAARLAASSRAAHEHAQTRSN